MKLAFPKMNFDTLGWVTAGVLGVVLFTSGFGPTNQTFAIADLPSLVDNSNVGKASQAAYLATRQSRLDLLTFMKDNQVMSGDQTQQLVKLWTEAAPPASDQQALKDLKTQIMANSKAYQDLQAKTTLTSADQTILDTDRKEIQAAQDSISALAQQFSGEMQALQQKSASDVLNKVRAAVQAEGKNQACSIVFIKTAAPYCDHDITQSVMDSLNKQPVSGQ